MVSAFETKHRKAITVCIMLATIMQVLDTTIANVALPHMAGGLSASQDEILWVLTSYIVSSAIATPVTGWFTTRYGRKTVFLWSIAGFTISSALCGAAPDLVTLILARVLQGAFGAPLIPLSQAIMLDINPPHNHGRAMSIWGMGVMIGPIIGPALGGWITDNYDWRWVFFINVPVGIFCVYGVWRYVQETARKTIGFDVFGFATLALALGLFQTMLDRGQELDWWSSIEIRIEAIGTVIALVFFLVHTTTKQPSFFNTALLRDRNFATGLGFYFLLGLLLYATRALLPPMLQTLLGYSAQDAGLVTAPSGLGTMIAMMIAGRTVGKIDDRLMLGFGFGLTALSCWQMAQYSPDITEWDIIYPGFIQGMGVGFCSVPLTTATFSTLNPALRNDGTAIFSLSRNVGSSVGISFMQVLQTRNAYIMYGSLGAMINTQQLDPAMSLAALSDEVARQAAFVSYLDDFKLMAIMTVISLPFLFLMKAKRKNEEPAGDEAVMIME